MPDHDDPPYQMRIEPCPDGENNHEYWILRCPHAETQGLRLDPRAFPWVPPATDSPASQWARGWYDIWSRHYVRCLTARIHAGGPVDMDGPCVVPLAELIRARAPFPPTEIEQYTNQIVAIATGEKSLCEIELNGEWPARY